MAFIVAKEITDLAVMRRSTPRSLRIAAAALSQHVHEFGCKVVRTADDWTAAPNIGSSIETPDLRTDYHCVAQQR